MLPLEIEPPIIQGRKDREVGKWQTTEARRRAALDGQASRATGNQPAQRRDHGSGRHGLKLAEVEDWRDRFLLGAENALRAWPKEDEALREEELNRFKRKVGESTMDLEIPQTAARLRPKKPATSDER